MSDENVHRIRICSKTLKERGFLKTPAFRLRVDGRKRRFSNTMIGSLRNDDADGKENTKNH